jgi:hypothetical protein
VGTDVQEPRAIGWRDALEIGIEGQGWTGQTARPYDRLPARAEGVVTPEVWGHSRKAAGLCVRFATDASVLHARWAIYGEPFGDEKITRVAHAGLDLYARLPDGRWSWVAVGLPSDRKDTTTILRENMTPPASGLREYMLYLPYSSEVERLEIGVPHDAAFRALPPRTDRPIAYYGTSIVHGYHASRPGMTHAAQLARRLDHPVLNLGFAGCARMETAIAELLGELDACVYVLDPVPNMWPEILAERPVPFVRLLRERHPATPIVMVEDRIHAHAPFDAPLAELHAEHRRLWREAFETLLAEGCGDMHYIEHSALIGTDGDGTMDGSHPTDLGFWRYAEVLEPVLRPLIPKT